MNSQVIIKNDGSSRVKPNLSDYDQTYNNFSWDNTTDNLFWFPNHKINIAANVIDRHIQTKRRDKVAMIWENDQGEEKRLTFYDLFCLSNKFANFLKSQGINKGDRVFFFLSRVPEIYYGFIGALKSGAVPGTLFPAFGPQALLERLKNSDAKILITEESLVDRTVEIKSQLPSLQNIIVREELENTLKDMSVKFPCEAMEPTDPAYMLYTSATGNTPVCGIVVPHSAIAQQDITAKWVLDLHDDDVYWCTADPGWVTGIAYGILAPWSLGITQIVYSGRFDPAKWYEIIQKHKVSVLYTAPTALRMLAKEEELAKKYDFSSLRHICSVGEALTPASIRWSLKIFHLPVHDTWWQTETGAMMVCNYPSVPIKPGSMGKPVPGIKALIVDDEGKELPVGKEGNLAFIPNWPSRMIDVWKNRERYESYFKNSLYYSGDRAKQDEEGYFWFVGRADDVIKTSGERVAPFDVESSLMEHPSVLEVGVIGKPDPLRGEIIKAFIVLKPGFADSEELIQQLQQHVKTNLAGHAYPREIEFLESLPKNNSGKIVRRVLKEKELGSSGQ